MKAHTSDFKNEIKKLGKQIDAKITYELNGDTIELGAEELNSVKPLFKTSLLKSAMKQLNIDSVENIPLGTIVNAQFGLLVGDEYEYIDFGNYVVYSSEKSEDEQSYTIKCYDKLLYSMKDYEALSVAYPISLKNYLIALCQKIGLEFKDSNFANYNKMLSQDLYDGQGYTYRDVLDQIAEATGSVICLDNQDRVEVRYINRLSETFDEEFLKDTNIKFGQKYGPINSVVLSRSAESDNIYKKDQQSIDENGLCEIKIVDNQIMNFNDRDEYLNNIFNKLNGLEYYINDFVSTGITYLDIMDRYFIQIGENTYNCLMLNDEITIEQGLEENIITEMPETSETDYTKSDKTDRKINQTYLIVDKQNQTISSVVSQVDNLNSKTTTLQQDVDTIKGEISDIVDITVSGEGIGSIELDKINDSEPIYVKIYPTGVDIKLLYPLDQSLAHASLKSGTTKSGISPALSYQETSTFGIFPSENLYPNGGNIITFANDDDYSVDYTLPCDLLWYSSEIKDEFIIDNENLRCYKIHKVGINAQGQKYALDNTFEEDFTFPFIHLEPGDYTITFSVPTAYIFARLLASNIYTNQFATRVELNSAITQSSQAITQEVNRQITLVNGEVEEVSGKVELKVDKDDNDQVVSMLNASADQIYLKSNRLKVDSDNFKLSNNGTVTATNVSVSGSVSGSTITGSTISGNNISGGTISGTTITGTNISGNSISGGSVSGTTISGSNISGNAISGGSINVGNNSYYLRMGSDWTRNPEVSGLNVAGGGINMNNHGISNVSSVSRASGDLYLAANNGTVHIGHSVSGEGKPIEVYSSKCYINQYLDVTTVSFYVRKKNGTRIQLQDYINEASSRKIKENIKPIKKTYENKLYDEVKDLKLYSYDYKKEYREEDRLNKYGFMIDDIENKEIGKLLDIDKGEDYSTYSGKGLAKLDLIIIKQLMDKIEKLEERIDILEKENEKWKK